MRCDTARKWISDDLDRRLSGRRAEPLRRHLQRCAACRAYRGDVALIQVRTQAQPTASLAPEDWSRFERNLERELRTAPQALGRMAPPLGLRMRWVWAGAAMVLVAGMTVFYLATRGSASLDPAFLSYEESLDQIYREIRDDPGLADSLNRLVLASIGESVRPGQSDLPIDLLANPDFLEGWAGDTWRYPQDENGPEAP